MATIFRPLNGLYRSAILWETGKRNAIQWSRRCHWILRPHLAASESCVTGAPGWDDPLASARRCLPLSFTVQRMFHHCEQWSPEPRWYQLDVETVFLLVKVRRIRSSAWGVNWADGVQCIIWRGECVSYWTRAWILGHTTFISSQRIFLASFLSVWPAIATCPIIHELKYHLIAFFWSANFIRLPKCARWTRCRRYRLLQASCKRPACKKLVPWKRRNLRGREGGWDRTTLSKHGRRDKNYHLMD